MAMATRIGALLIVTGATLAFALGGAWAVIGATLMIGGGIVVALVLEEGLDRLDSPAGLAQGETDADAA
jgi:hypothetical protein